jgi:hypothetical protein
MLTQAQSSHRKKGNASRKIEKKKKEWRMPIYLSSNWKIEFTAIILYNYTCSNCYFSENAFESRASWSRIFNYKNHILKFLNSLKNLHMNPGCIIHLHNLHDEIRCGSSYKKTPCLSSTCIIHYKVYGFCFYTTYTKAYLTMKLYRNLVNISMFMFSLFKKKLKL